MKSQCSSIQLNNNSSIHIIVLNFKDNGLKLVWIDRLGSCKVKIFVFLYEYEPCGHFLSCQNHKIYLFFMQRSLTGFKNLDEVEYLEMKVDTRENSLGNFGKYQV